MKTLEPKLYPTILGGVSRGFWSPFLNWGTLSAVFWHLKTGTFASSESSGEKEDASKVDHKKKKVDEFSDFSEEDEEDEDDVRESRQATKKKQLEDVEVAMKGGARIDTSLYQPDKSSRQFAKRFFIHPLLIENNKDYRKLSPTDQEKVQDMVVRGRQRTQRPWASGWAAPSQYTTRLRSRSLEGCKTTS